MITILGQVLMLLITSKGKSFAVLLIKKLQNLINIHLQVTEKLIKSDETS